MFRDFLIVVLVACLNPTEHDSNPAAGAGARAIDAGAHSPERAVGPEVVRLDEAAIFRKVIRGQGQDGDQSYRIPGLATTVKGSLLAVFDIRRESARDLPANIDVGLLRSTDQGETWSPLQVILDYDSRAPGSLGNGVGDPSLLVDRETGVVWVAALWSKGDRGWNGSGPGLTPDETGQLVVTRSADDGVTWSPPINITSQVKRPEWFLCFQGPGAGIQLRDGTLVFPAQFRDAKQVAHSCFIYSKDHGTHWFISPPAIPTTPPTSESQIAELSDGSLLLSMRDESRSGRRAWSRFLPGRDISHGHWTDTRFDLPDPTCMASLVRHPKGFLFFSNPGSERRREALTIRASRDDGKTWSKGLLIDPRPSAYSCMTVLSDGRVGILYECGDRSANETLTFSRLSVGSLLDEP